MLGKLFKYEMKATGRLILPFYLALLGMTVVFRVFSVFKLPPSMWQLQQVASVLAVTVFVILMVATFVVTFIVTVARFYKNLYGDEGYLMNTLPVTPAQNIWTKALATAVWSLASTVVVILTGFIFFFGNKLPDLGRALAYLWQQFTQEFLPYITGTDTALLVVVMAEMALLMLLGLVVGPIYLYLCISLGQQVSRHKILASFGIYLAITMVLQTVASLFVALLGNTGLERWAWRMVEQSPFGFVALVLVVYLVVEVAIGAASFGVTNHMLGKKLNLE